MSKQQNGEKSATKESSGARRATARKPSADSKKKSSKPRRKNTRRSRAIRNMLPVMLLAVVAVAAIVTVVVSFRMKTQPPQEKIVAHKEELQGISMAIKDRNKLYNSPLNWSNIGTDSNGYLAYKTGGQAQSLLGIDVSEHNAQINWQKVKAAGVSFAYIRIGYRGSQAGNIVEDSTFAQNIAGAREVGIKVGIYFFSQAINETEAREEADFVFSKLGGSTIDYPVAFDMEPTKNGTNRIDNLTNDQMTAIAAAFCRQCVYNGHNAIIYGNQYDLLNYNLTMLMDYGFWYAEYRSKPTMNLNFGMWQYTNQGKVPGISGSVDINLDLTPALAQTGM